MKTNPPASSSSPTSRKKPRIMRHLLCHARRPRQPLTAQRGKFNLVSILSALSACGPRFRRGPERVDAAKRALYKTPNSGGGDPPAAVLFAAPPGVSYSTLPQI